MHGMWYGGYTSYLIERLLGADLGPMEPVAEIFENIDELQGGIAKLIFNANRANDGFAILYSPASLEATALFKKGLAKAVEWKNQS